MMTTPTPTLDRKAPPMPSKTFSAPTPRPVALLLAELENALTYPGATRHLSAPAADDLTEAVRIAAHEIREQMQTAARLDTTADLGMSPEDYDQAEALLRDSDANS